MRLVPGALIVLHGDEVAVEELATRAAAVNNPREVWLPGPLVVRREGDVAAQSSAVIQPALAAGIPVITAGYPSAEVIAAGEPIADLEARVSWVDSRFPVEPVVVGSPRSGYRTVLYGSHGADLLENLFIALLQASLVGLPVGVRG
jgi:hypothetical protein